MKLLRTEKVTTTETFRSQCAHTRGDGSLSYPYLAKTNGVTLGQFEVARSQPDPKEFGSKKSAQQFAERVVEVKIYDVFGRLIAVPA